MGNQVRKNSICLSCVVVMILFPLVLTAQVITAPFDPTEAVYMPAAAGWREGSAIGFSYDESSGNRDLDNREIYTFETTGTSANGFTRFDNISLDVGWLTSQTDTTVEEGQEFQVHLNHDVTVASIALTGNDFVALGLGMQVRNSEDHQDASNDSVCTTETAVVGGVSIRPVEFLYLGGGFQRIKQESSKTVDNTWNVLTLGVALMVGQPGETRFRTEYSYSSSPKEESNARGDLDAAIHDETVTTRFSAELILNGLLFSLKMQEEKRMLDEPYEYNGKRHEEMVFTHEEAGVLWVPPEGLALGFYFGTYRTSFYFDDENTAFKINLAYKFE